MPVLTFLGLLGGLNGSADLFFFFPAAAVVGAKLKTFKKTGGIRKTMEVVRAFKRRVF